MANSSDNGKTILIVVLVIALGAIGYYLYQEQQSDTVGLKIGDAEISAEVEG